jgi:hypothetical protein
MAISDFYPFQPNQKVTTEQWNELFAAIANGEFFLDGTYVSEQIKTLADRVTSLEGRMDYLYSLKARQRKRQQFVLENNQGTVVLDEAPMLDSEIISYNGSNWSKTGIPMGFTGDYSLSERTITINPDNATQIIDGDVLVVTYEFEVL